MGLATVYGIVKQHRGDLVVESEQGKGSTFTIYLPRAPEKQQKQEHDLLPTSSHDGHETILLVEDDPMVRAVTASFLTNKGYTIIEAVDGDEALRAVLNFSGTIHLLLTDVILPKLSGPDLAKKVLELCPDIKIIYMSGYAQEELLASGMDLRTVHFIQKPLRPAHLAETARKVLDSGPCLR